MFTVVESASLAMVRTWLEILSRRAGSRSEYEVLTLTIVIGASC